MAKIKYVLELVLYLAIRGVLVFGTIEMQRLNLPDLDMMFAA